MANAGKKTTYFSQHPWIISLVLLVLLVLWVGSGHSQESATEKSAPEKVPLTQVAVETFYSEPVIRTISLYGKTAPDRDATISAEADGRITKVSVRKGASVKKGDLLLFIDKGDREAQLDRAEALCGSDNKNLRQPGRSRKKAFKEKWPTPWQKQIWLKRGQP